MAIIPMICALVGAVGMAVIVCFVKSNKLIFLFNTIGILCLSAFALLATNYADAFNGLTQILILSTLPLVLTVFNFESFAPEKKNNIETATEETITENKPKPTILTPVINALGFLLTGICLSVAGLYLGTEKFYIILFGVATGFALTFLHLIITNKQKNKEKTSFLIDFSINFLQFLACGLILSSAVGALIYSLALKNIMFALGTIFLAAHIIIKKYIKHRFVYILLYVGVTVLLSSILL